MNPHERVAKLIALASDPSSPDNERRNAAVSAVKLIVEHKMLGGSRGNGEAPKNGFMMFIESLPLDAIFRNVNATAIAASSLEILELRDVVERLKRQNEALRTEARELNTKLIKMRERRARRRDL